MDPSNVNSEQNNLDDAFQAGLQAALAETKAKSSTDVHVTSDPDSIAEFDSPVASLPIRPAENKACSTAKEFSNPPAVLSEVNGNAAPNAQAQTSDSPVRIENEAGEDRWGGDHGGDQFEVAVVDENVPKKKKKSKSKKKKGLNQPSGFEEYYVDAPVTPQEFEEELELYSSERPFSVRIQTAIQRYTARRKFDEVRKSVFDKYMVFGGIESGPKMFTGGLDDQTLEESTAAEIAGITATNYVGDDKMDERARDFVVDFDVVLKGFLSSRLPQYFDLTLQSQIKTYIAVIRNFLNYLLHHNVCIEYNDQINAARTTCTLAENQLWKISQAAKYMPGDFNIACSTFFGGYYRDTRIGDATWAQGIDIDRGMTEQRAQRIFKTGLAAYGDQRTIDKYTDHVRKNKARVIDVISSGFEITEILPAHQEVLKMYADPVCAGLSPLGRLMIKVWHNPFLPPKDLTEDEEAEEAELRKVHKSYELWIEDSVLAHCFVGMKFDATIRHLSFGIYYLDSWQWGYCTFYTVLPNELMLGFKKHRYLPPRPKKTGGDEESVDGEKDGADHEGDSGKELEQFEEGEDIEVGI